MASAVANPSASVTAGMSFGTRVWRNTIEQYSPEPAWSARFARNGPAPRFALRRRPRCRIRNLRPPGGAPHSWWNLSKYADRCGEPESLQGTERSAALVELGRLFSAFG